MGLGICISVIAHGTHKGYPIDAHYYLNVTHVSHIINRLQVDQATYFEMCDNSSRNPM